MPPRLRVTEAGTTETVARVASTLTEYDKTVIEVAGHTDSIGSDPYNQQLSEQRANNVAAYLAGRNVARTRMVTIGAGETRPVASNVPVTQDNVQKAKQG